MCQTLWLALKFRNEEDTGLTLTEHTLSLGGRQESLLIMMQDNGGGGSNRNTQVVCTESPNSSCKGQKLFEREMMPQYRLRGLEIVCQANKQEGDHSTES